MLFGMADELANAGEDYRVKEACLRSGSRPEPRKRIWSSRSCCPLITDFPKAKCLQGLHA